MKYIDITIIDDNEWEENEVFFLKISRYDYKDDTVNIGDQSITEVTIINDDGRLGSCMIREEWDGQVWYISKLPGDSRNILLLSILMVGGKSLNYKMRIAFFQ